MALTKVSGNILDPGINVAGVVTATRFDGPFSDLTTTELDVTGISTFKNDVEFVGPTAGITSSYWDKSANEFKFKDGVKLSFGDGRDLQLQHNGSDSVISQSAAGTGDLKILSGGAQSIECIKAGAVNIAHNGNTKLTTTGYGVTITGGVTVGAALTVQGDLYVEGTRTEVKSATLEITDKTIGISSTASPSDTTADGAGIVVYGATDKSLKWENSSDSWLSSEHIKVPDDKRIFCGTGTDLSIYHSSNQSIIKDSYGDLRICGDTIRFRNGGNSSTAMQIQGNAATTLYHNAAPKFATSSTGITVTGEVAASQDYPNIRPVLDFNFAATKKLDPRMEFYSTGESSYHDGVGSVKFVSNNEPRFEHDIVTGECKGLMFEGSGTNYSWYSRRFDSIASGSWVPQNGGATPTVTANTYTAPDGTSSGAYMADTITGATGTAFNGNVMQQQHSAGANVKHTFSMYIKLITSTQATIYIRDGATGSISSASAIPNTRNWQRVVVTSSAALTNSTTHSFYFGNTNGTIAVWGSQIERSDYVSSYIKTEAGANGTRTADDGGVRLGGEDVTDVFNQGEGTLIAEAIPTLAEANQAIVGFYQDFGSVNRIELRSQGTNVANARFESVVGSSSVVNMTGSAHAGVNNVSKYAYAFQENNYAASVNGGTVQTDTSGAFPHGTGIDSMIIGDAVYTKEHSIIIKRVMYYADRLPDSQLITLTS